MYIGYLVCDLRQGKARSIYHNGQVQTCKQYKTGCSKEPNSATFETYFKVSMFWTVKIFHVRPYTTINNFDEKVFILIVFYLLMSRSTEIKLMIHWQIKMGCCSQHKRVTQTNNPVLGAMHIPKIPIILTIEHCISVILPVFWSCFSSTVFIIFHFIHLRWSSQ